MVVTNDDYSPDYPTDYSPLTTDDYSTCRASPTWTLSTAQGEGIAVVEITFPVINLIAPFSQLGHLT